MYFQTFRKALSLLSRKERRQGKLVLTMVLVMALLETAGVASIMPFLALLGNPDLIQTNRYLAHAYEIGGFRSTNEFLLAIGVASFLLVMFSSLFCVVTHYVMNRFVEMRRHSVGERLLETYLRQPYAFFLNRHSSDMSKSILSEVDHLIQYAFRPCIHMISYSVVLVALVVLLLVINPLPALIVATLLGGAYAAVFLCVKGILGRIGRDRVQANLARFTAASEALWGIKDIKLYGREREYLARFRDPSIRQARHHATNKTLSQVPKYIMEGVAFGSIILLTLVLLQGSSEGGSGALGEVLPILGVYAFAGYRILPAAQHVYDALARLRFSAGAVDSVHDDLRRRATSAELPARRPERLVPHSNVALAKISYTYPGAAKPSLMDVNLTIEVGTRIGIAGPTGSGKTTLVDIILGLLRPTAGSILVDGVPLEESNLRAWQQSLGYVPQEIFLSDKTVAENIAFGVPPALIDFEQVARSARAAQIHEFIMKELPQQYHTTIGERGVRLSGGQRQRLGIARALYHDPPILVLDEATSALDVGTEMQVMSAIGELSREKTVILIAHRTSTLTACDRVVMVKDGQIAEVRRLDEMKVGDR